MQLSETFNPTQKARACGSTFAARAFISTEESATARIFERIIFILALAVFVLAAIPYGSVEAWWEAAFACAAFALGALWMFEGLLRGRWGVRGLRLLAPVACLMLFAWLQTVPLPALGENKSWVALSADPYETRRFVLKIGALMVWGALVLRSLTNRRRLRALVCLVTGIAIASAVFGVARQAAQQTVYEGGFGLAHLTRGVGYGQFINRNHFALLMEMGLGLELGYVAAGGVRSRRMIPLCLGALVPLCGAVVLTNSRGGIFSMLAQFGFVALMWALIRRRGAQDAKDAVESAAVENVRGNGARALLRGAVYVVVTLSLATSLLVAVIWLGGGPLVAKMEMLPEEVRAGSVDERAGVKRLEVWRATLALIESHAVVGSGFGAYPTAVTRTHDASGEWSPEAAHNEYLELLAGGGLVGAALFVWFVATLSRYVVRALRARDFVRRAACLGALSSIVGVALHSAGEFGLHITINSLALTALFVIIVAAGDGKLSEEEEKKIPA